MVAIIAASCERLLRLVNQVLDLSRLRAGVLTLDRIEQADARVGKGAEAVRSALEMADLFAHLRAAAAR